MGADQEREMPEELAAEARALETEMLVGAVARGRITTAEELHDAIDAVDIPGDLEADVRTVAAARGVTLSGGF